MTADLETLRAGYLRLRGALYDRATGLPAYPVLLEELRAWLESRRRIGVIHVEATNLSAVESFYGWQVSDGVLGAAARALADHLPAVLGEGSVASVDGVGADRFVVFVPSRPGGADVDGAWLRGASVDLRERLEAAFDADEFLGLAPRPEFREGHAVLTEDPFLRFERRVRAAIEEARGAAGRRESRREAAQGAELRRILEQEAVTAVFQPVVDLVTGAILGHEALARGPSGTDLERPGALFGAGRRAGVEADLDRLCRRAALRAAGGTLPGKLFVNVLPSGLDDPDWRRPSFAGLLAQAERARGDLVVEVTERGADADPEALAAGCLSLRAEGFGICLDDVGTGYASLATLEAVRPDYVKADTTIVRGIDASPIKQELVGSLVGIGERLGAQVIAEGVEREEEARTLRRLGARYAQGHLFAVPAPASALRTGGVRR